MGTVEAQRERTFAGVPRPNAYALAHFLPPPIGRDLCFGCWAPNEHPTWSEAEAAGWWSGTWSGPDWAVLCPDCADDHQHSDVEP